MIFKVMWLRKYTPTNNGKSKRDGKQKLVIDNSFLFYLFI